MLDHALVQTLDVWAQKPASEYSAQNHPPTVLPHVYK